MSTLIEVIIVYCRSGRYQRGGLDFFSDSFCAARTYHLCDMHFLLTWYYDTIGWQLLTDVLNILRLPVSRSHGSTFESSFKKIVIMKFKS